MQRFCEVRFQIKEDWGTEWAPFLLPPQDPGRTVFSFQSLPLLFLSLLFHFF